MGLPTRSAVRSIDTTVAGIELRFTAFDGDALVLISPMGVDRPLVGEVDRIDNGTIQVPRLSIFDTAILPILAEASDAVLAAAAAHYREPRGRATRYLGSAP